VACHRYQNDGGAQGPDLTSAAGRFSKRDLLESIIDPNKVISDQYAAVIITTDDGKLVTGRIINLAGNNIMLNTDMLNPTAITSVDHRKVESIVTSKVSMMPAGLIDTLKEEEIYDLIAYILSRGDASSPMFSK
jgi:putative heme-binding domain-containing protein